MSRHPVLSGRRSGFSLLEVLVALALFAIAASGILTAMGNHLKQVSFMQDHAHALRLATREMNALRRMKVLEAGETAGVEGRFTWQTAAETEGFDDWPGLAGLPGTPARLRVSVQWGDTEAGPTNGQVRLDGFAYFGAAR